MILCKGTDALLHVISLVDWPKHIKSFFFWRVPSHSFLQLQCVQSNLQGFSLVPDRLGFAQHLHTKQRQCSPCSHAPLKMHKIKNNVNMHMHTYVHNVCARSSELGAHLHSVVSKLLPLLLGKHQHVPRFEHCIHIDTSGVHMLTAFPPSGCCCFHTGLSNKLA